MPRNPKPPKLTKTWKMEILQIEIDSVNSTFEMPQTLDPGEEALLIQIRDGIEQWADELKGASKTKLTRDDIDWRIDVLDERIKCNLWIVEEDDSLDDSDRLAMMKENEGLKQWKAELRAQKRTS